MLLQRPTQEWELVYVSRNMRVICQIPCVVTTPSSVTANVCSGSTGEDGGLDQHPSPVPQQETISFVYPLRKKTKQNQKKATSRCRRLSPLTWPSVSAGREPWECGELNFHWVSCIVVTVWLTLEITLCRIPSNPHRPGHDPSEKH